MRSPRTLYTFVAYMVPSRYDSGSASREGCRMSKGSMLKLFELNGRGQSLTAVALPGQHHSQSGCFLLWTIQQPPCTGTQARGAGETDWWTLTRSVRPSSRAFGRPE